MAQAFISWSGSQARVKARALRNLYEDVLPEASIFMSDEDIALGSVWLETIAGSLEASVAGVIIVTPENIRSPWVHYEAGALATRVERRMVIPLLSGVTPDDLATTPLSIFQATPLSKQSVLSITLQFAKALGSARAEPALTRAFEKWWGDYEEILLKPLSAAKPTAPSLPEIHQLLTGLQSQARGQADAIARLTALVEAQASRSFAATPTTGWPQSPPSGWLNPASIGAATTASDTTASDVARLLANSVNAADIGRIGMSPHAQVDIARANANGATIADILKHAGYAGFDDTSKLASHTVSPPSAAGGITRQRDTPPSKGNPKRNG